VTTTFEEVKAIVIRVLQLRESAESMLPSTPLLGAVPHLDSLGVMSIIAELEERFGISVDDDDIDREIFATLGTLSQFVEAKLDR